MHDYYRQLQAEGKWAPDGPDDVLSRALGTPEPRGRVRGVGHGVSKEVYWNTPKSRKNNKSKAPASNDTALRREFDERFQAQQQILEQTRRENEEYRRGQAELLQRMAQQEEMMRRFMAQQSGSGSNVPPPPPPSYFVPEPPVQQPAPSQSRYVPGPPMTTDIVPLQPLLLEVLKFTLKPQILRTLTVILITNMFICAG